MKKTFLITALAILVIISILALQLGKEGSETSKEKVIKIAYLPVIQALPLYLALEKGYFEDAGIKTEIIKFESPNQIIDALLANQVDMAGFGAATGIPAISEYKKPGALKFFGVNGATKGIVNDVLIKNTKSDIQTIADLKGKKLGILPGIQFRTIAQHILLKNGLSETDVQVIEIGPSLQVQALAAGQVDAVLSLEPVRIVALSKGVAEDLIESPMVTYISDPWYGGSAIFTTTFIENNPEFARRVADIFGKAVKEIRENPDSARQYLKGYLPLDDDLIKSVDLPLWKIYDEINQTDIDALQRFFDIFTEHKVIDGRVNAQKMFYKG